jgi:hypothetical protein
MSIKNTDKYGFTWPRGDSLPLNFEFTDTEGIPVNITGWTIFFTLKKNRGDIDSAAILTRTIAPASLTDPVNGQTVFTIADTETDSLLGTYYWDAQLKTIDGLIYTIISGTITFLEDVTRRTG